LVIETEQMGESSLVLKYQTGFHRVRVSQSQKTNSDRFSIVAQGEAGSSNRR